MCVTQHAIISPILLSFSIFSPPTPNIMAAPSMAVSCENVGIGPWGGKGRTSFDFGQNSVRIIKINICSGTVVDSLQIEYMDANGNIILTPRAGGSGGVLTEIQLSPDEYIHKMVGSYVTFNDETCITKLEFITNLKPYGPFGSRDGICTEFTLPTKDNKIVGFFGEYDDYINAIGAYVAHK